MFTLTLTLTFAFFFNVVVQLRHLLWKVEQKLVGDSVFSDWWKQFGTQVCWLALFQEKLSTRESLQSRAGLKPYVFHLFYNHFEKSDWVLMGGEAISHLPHIAVLEISYIVFI